MEGHQSLSQDSTTRPSRFASLFHGHAVLPGASSQHDFRMLWKTPLIALQLLDEKIDGSSSALLHVLIHASAVSKFRNPIEMRQPDSLRYFPTGLLEPFSSFVMLGQNHIRPVLPAPFDEFGFFHDTLQ